MGTGFAARKHRLGPVIAVLVLAVLAPNVAHAGWNQPWTGQDANYGGLNFDTTAMSLGPDIANVGGTPYVAWDEADGTNREVRVARLNASGGWEQPWTGTSGGYGGINESDSAVGGNPRIASLEGVPYVAWVEDNIRVARLEGSQWNQPWKGTQGATPWGGVQRDATRAVGTVELAAIGGTLYVAWTESDGTNQELRVAKLDDSTPTPTWREIASDATPTSGGINSSTTTHANVASIGGVGGVPYVAWTEASVGGANQEVRVARFDETTDTWEEPWTGVSADYGGINQSNGGAVPVRQADILGVGGVPYVAWAEFDEPNCNNFEIRVARLDGSTWKQAFGGGAGYGGVNNSDEGVGQNPRLFEAGGRPYLTWTESLLGPPGNATCPGPVNGGVRVARLDASLTRWEEVVGGTDAPLTGDLAQATAIGGVPYVTFQGSGGSNVEPRVARLEPEFLTTSGFASETGANLLAEVRTYGVAYPIGFEYGPGGGFGTQTSPTTTNFADDKDVVLQQVGGLTPGTAYSLRAFGTDLTRRTATGPVTGFTTTATPTGTGGGGTGDGGGGGSTTPTDSSGGGAEQPLPKLLVALIRSKLKTDAGEKVKVPFLATADGDATLDVLRRGNRVVRIERDAIAGENRITWSGKVKSRPASPGRYSLELTVRGTDGQTASDEGSLKID